MSGVVNRSSQESNTEVDIMENGNKRNEPDEKEKNDDERREKFDILVAVRNALEAYASKHRKLFKVLGLILLNAGVLVYLGFASEYWLRKGKSHDCGYCWCTGYGMLILLLGFTYGGLFYYCVVKRYFGMSIRRCFRPVGRCIEKLQVTRYGPRACPAVIYLIILAAIVTFLVIDTLHSTNRLISGLGVIVLLLIGWLCSKHPAHINWRPVLCGLIMQFSFGLLTIRWSVGRAIFQCISAKVAIFLHFAKEGAAFIFSKNLVDQGIFAFSVLPVIVFFSFFIQILYYLGVMQWVILKLGWVLQRILGTTLCESLNCAANTFIGMSESPLLIKPYIGKLTSSEIHAVMCSGFATVSGSVFAAYIGFGAQPAHLLTASIMSAPASLCYSKLFYPETEKSQTDLDNIQLEKSEDSGLLDAATNGALAAIPMVLGIIANIIAFVSFVAFINSLLSWCGLLLGFKNWSFEFFLSKIFMPLSWIMGVPWNKCEEVGYLIGLKTVVNEFIAYEQLGRFKKMNVIYGRTEAIATYAICGFANPGSIGIMMGSLSTLAPEKREQIAAVTLRAFFAGSAVCFLTASFAGMLMDDDSFIDTIVANETMTTLDYTLTTL